MKVALVHDYLVEYGGGERMLELFHELYPHAPVYTLIYAKEAMPNHFRSWDIHTSFINKLPLKQKFFKYYVPLMPVAMESFDLSSFDVVISVCSSFSKGVLTGYTTCHISYTLTVPRFLWGYETSTQQKYKRSIFLPCINTYLRVWDKSASDRVDFFLANSQTVKWRIAKAYGRKAKVIYSPVDETKFLGSSIHRERFYLIVSRLEAYKHIDLAIKTCLRHNKKLVIIGDGPMREQLEKLAQGRVDFLGKVSDDILLRYYNSANAVIFPGADDLGLVPIEAQLCGTPVIAYRKDGALETITENVSGVFFDQYEEHSLFTAMEKLDILSLDPEKIRENGLQFSYKAIKSNFKAFISDSWHAYQESYGLI